MHAAMARNERCSCGSGKRWKHCHGAAGAGTEAETARTPRADAARPDPYSVLRIALARQKEGQLAAAEALYQQAFEALPSHFDAMHMLGVVKLQLGKFDEATPLLVSALPLAPAGAMANLKHNLGLCLLGRARERGVPDALAAVAPLPRQSDRFLRACAIRGHDAAPKGRISVLLVGAAAGADVSCTLDSLRQYGGADLEVIASVAGQSSASATLRAALEECGWPVRILVGEAAATLAGELQMGTEVATGDHLCMLRAGDRWTSAWLLHLSRALQASGAPWGFSGLRMISGDRAIAGFGSSRDVDALLREFDGLYAHRTASLAFPSFDPIAGGRNLMVRTDFWRRSGGLVAGAADPVLDWAWRAARISEPVYVDEPDYLIPAASAAVHRHGGFAPTGRPATAPVNDSGMRDGDFANGVLQGALPRYWTLQWQKIQALQSSLLPADVLIAFTRAFGLLPADTGVPARGGPVDD